MLIKPFAVTREITTNAYFYIDERSKHGFLLDPGAEADKLLQIITENDWKIEKILLTHGHFDHIGAVQKLHQELSIPYYIHIAGERYLTDPAMNLSAFFGSNITIREAEYLDDNEIISLEAAPDTNLQVIHCPGHTADSVMYYDKQKEIAFVGDTIFRHSIGRTDLPGGNETALWRSIRQKIFTLPRQTLLYSGHSPQTSVGEEADFWS